MSFLRKERGVDVLDLTLLQKKGILKIPPQAPSPEFLDLTVPRISAQEGPQPPEMPGAPTPPAGPVPPTSFFDFPAWSEASGSTPIANNPFALLDSMAGSGTALSQGTGGSSPVDPAAFNALKIKLDDLEFKLDRLVEKFSLLDDRLTKGL